MAQWEKSGRLGQERCPVGTVKEERAVIALRTRKEMGCGVVGGQRKGKSEQSEELL